jgi:hypothetical protein
VGVGGVGSVRMCVWGGVMCDAGVHAY